MTDAGTTPADDQHLRAIGHAVAAVERAEVTLQDAIDAARAAEVPDEAIARALAARHAGTRALARELVAQLGPAFVAALAAASSTQLAAQWAEPAGPLPGPEALRRLRLAHQVWSRLAQARGAEAARSWFVTANPDLAGDSPLATIKRDRVRELLAAVDLVLGDPTGR